ncbi:YhcN/YlaJ family sporulation lipoprotein [Calidifontibacillus erzurumensis]|uniref:YhcN/YlaJ family sporulation lipoprotein n=1 Tax=Calidifontibacillus erzurumensis TaxID=2741433 RepID=UPI0035B5033C
MQKLWILALALFIIAGCAQNESKESVGENNQNYAMEISQKTNNANRHTLNGEERAEYLANLAARVPDVKDATAVVAGDYAVIGIDVDKDLDRSRVGSIKYSVAEALKDDPLGANAVVVADPDTVERLREMRDEIANGRPIEGIINELAAIVGRMMPQIPQDLNKNEDPLEQNDKQLSNKQEKQLENIKKEQSSSKM